MTRIFLTLASVSTLLLVTVFFIGLNIGDARLPESQGLVSWHMMLALTGLVFATLVHALVFTYFMGTGRWMEDVSKAYELQTHWGSESQKLKYRILPLMSFCFVMLLVTVGFGAAADPASKMGFEGFAGLKPATCHMLVAITTVTVNFLANIYEFQALERNGNLVNEVMAKVREIRVAKGLPV